VCVAQAWMGEVNGARGRKRSVGGWWLCFKGEGARRGGRRVEAERERERGALGAAWHRRGSGPTAARAVRCHTTVEGGGVDAMRDGVTDRWAEMRRGGGGGGFSSAGCFSS
jgi:hypothetical protein